MATQSIEKSLNQAPLGIADLAADEPELEIEVALEGEDDTGMELAEIEVTLPSHDDNLACCLPDQVLTKLANDLETAVDEDLMARSDWEKTYKEGIELLGLHMEERTEPWPGACGVFHPLITEACVRFQAELTTETFPASGPVRTKIIGKETPEKKAAATRVEEDMNHELTDKMPEFRPEHERMLWNLPMSGSAFKKVNYDPTLGRQTSVFVPAEDIILPYGTTDLGTCNRLTHRFRKTMIDVRRLQNSGFYRDVDIQEAQTGTTDIQEKKDKEAGNTALNDVRPEFYEVHADLVLDDFNTNIGDSLDVDRSDECLPYVVTLVKGQSIVVAIRRNWKEEDELHLKRQHFVHYQYVPGFGAYGFGLFHLVGGYARSATSIMRQLVDAGTLSNLPAGYKTRGLRVKGENGPLRPGEFRDVDVGSGTIKDNIMPLPYKEPSVVLAGLLDKIIEDGRRLAATADVNISEMSANAPVGTTLALLERTLKPLTAVQARCHYVLKQELGLIAGIIRDYKDDDYEYEPTVGERGARKSDFALVDVLPVSDPNAATLSQRVVQYQAALQMAETSPQNYNLAFLHREMLDVLGIKNAAKILPMPEDMKPRDPVTENMFVLQNKPVKAFMLQDHEAHMMVHQMLLKDPKVQAAIGQNPQAQLMQGALMAHLAEHAGYAYRLHVAQQLGMPLPDPEEDMDPQVEKEIAPLLAQAAQQALMQNQKMMAQQQAQAMQQDPAFQLEQKKLAQKDKEIAVKELQVKGTLAVAADRQDLEEAKFEAETGNKLADFGLRQEDQAARLSAEGIRMGKEMTPTTGSDA